MATGTEIKEKISDLPVLPGSLSGYFVVGSKDNEEGEPESYKCDLGFIEEAATSANEAATNANEQAANAQERAAEARQAKEAVEATEEIIQDNEQSRQQQELSRSHQETIRQEEESTRQANEAQRQENESARHRQYAADHDTAHLDHLTAQEDHSTAELDHSTAQSDHSQAGSDHTQASTDHSTAQSDHTQAGSDHSQAEQDHTASVNAANACNAAKEAIEANEATRQSNETTRQNNEAARNAAEEARETQASADHSIASGDHEQAEEDHNRIVNRPYLSIEYLRQYLYGVRFGKIREDNGGDNVVVGGCSAFVRDGKLYRNFDYPYNDLATFAIQTKDFEATSLIEGLTDGALNDDLIAQLPYRLVDGKNNHGIMVSVHLLFNDFEWTGCGEKSIPLTRLPYLILSNVKSMATIADDLDGILDNLTSTEALDEKGYLLQCLVTDGTTTYAIVPPLEDGGDYVLIDATSNPKMANFRYANRAEVSRQDMDMQLHPTGIERFNAMPCNLDEIRFTKCYEAPDRLSEFIGIDETTKDSTDEELTAIYQTARAEYLARQRDGKTWHTMHSVIYGNGVETLCVQENFDDNVYADRYEEQRQANEAARQLAETARGNAESARQDAESSRESAETSRESAETARNTAEGQRASAETARAQQAASDHSTALSDHQTASSDHNTASSDHTQASFDHTAAAQDHTQAGSDHTRAESDHTTASEDHTASEEATESATRAAEAAMQVVNSMVAKEGDEMAAMAIIINQQNARIEALENALKFGLKKLVVDNLEVRCKFNQFVSEGNSYLRGAGAPSADVIPENWNEDEYGPWTGVPQYIGQRYLNTSTNKWYTAKGNTAVSDWVQDTNA